MKGKNNKTKAWKLDLKDKGTLTEATSKELDDGDLVITLKDVDFKKLALGKSNAQSLFLGGKLKVRGDVTKAVQVETILKTLAPAAAKL